MRQSAENQLGVVKRSVLNRGVCEIPSCNARRCPPLFIRSGECQRQARMAFDERAELAANVSAGPENTDGYLIHTECIIIQQAGVNQHSWKHRALHGEQAPTTRSDSGAYCRQ